MTGETESKMPTTDERHAKVEALLEHYPEEIGLGVLRPPNEVNRFLNLTATEQRKMTAEECGEAAVILSQSAVYIQMATNRIAADITWCNAYIDYLIADTISQMGTQYTPFPYRRILAIKNNDSTKTLQAIVSSAQLRVDAMQYIPNQLRGCATAFSDLQQTKRSQRT